MIESMVYVCILLYRLGVCVWFVIINVLYVNECSQQFNVYAITNVFVFRRVTTTKSITNTLFVINKLT